MLTPGTQNANPYTPREQFGNEDPGFKGMAASYQVPQNGSVQGQSAAGAAPNQAQRTFPSQYVNPAATDQILYTVPKIATTLNGATKAGLQTVTLTSAANVIPGMLLAIVDAVNTALNESVWVISVAQSTNQITAVFANAHATASTVTCSRTFFLTDYTVTTSSASQHPALLKARTTASSGAISAGSNTVTFNNPSISAQNGDICYVGSTVYIEDPSSGVYEAVVVTAVTRNTSGIITAFTATFINGHGANFVIGFPVELAYVNSTKGIEAIGIETQATVPPGMSLAFTTVVAVTGTVFMNSKGFEQ